MEPFLHVFETSLDSFLQPFLVVLVEDVLYQPTHGILAVVRGILGASSTKAKFRPSPQPLNRHEVARVSPVINELDRVLSSQFTRSVGPVDRKVVEEQHRFLPSNVVFQVF